MLRVAVILLRGHTVRDLRCEHSTIYLLTLLLMDMCTVFRLGQLHIGLIRIVVFWPFRGPEHSLLLGVYAQSRNLGYRLDVCSTSSEPAEPPPTVVAGRALLLAPCEDPRSPHPRGRVGSPVLFI